MPSSSSSFRHRDIHRDILWLGAHKTGTTYLQDLLSHSATALAEAHRCYIDMQSFRSLYTRPLLYPSQSAPQKTTSPDATVPDAPLLGAKGTTAPLLVPPLARQENGQIDGQTDAQARTAQASYLLFDENILALVQDVVHRSGLYPEGAERALRMAGALNLEAPDIVLGIRGFAGYLPSLYCEVLKSMPFLPFEDFNTAPLTALSWYDVIDRLQAAFPRSRLRIYRAEDLRGREEALLAWIADLPVAQIGKDRRACPQSNARQSNARQSNARREGFSHAAVTALHQLYQQAGQVSPADLAACLQAHPRNASDSSPGRTAYSPWSARERRDLELVYALDLEAIATLERVEIWTPPSRKDRF
ncbi:hypothetical protein PH5382_03320 [Phaeobacter sp. CECT 5382]|nr:hypothetical protein PH5382_03320 [Phaeobacter sp. CECT 5382]